MPRKRTYALYCTIISQGPLMIVRLPETPMRWTLLMQKLCRVLKADHGLLMRQIHGLEGLAGLPYDMDTPDEEKALRRLESAYMGDPEPFARFLLYDWDAENQTFLLRRGNSG